MIAFNVTNLKAQEKETEEKFNPSSMIMHHIADSHEWHLFTLKGEGDKETHISIPLPVILYSEKGGFDVFISSEMHHGEVVAGEGAHAHRKLERSGTTYYIDDHGHFATGYDEKEGKLSHEAADKVYDFSITKNVASMFLSVILLFIVFLSVAKGYKKNKGKAPKGIQSLLEPIIIFVRDDIAKANIGEKHYERFTPYLLTVFFFIWFNNLLGLMPAGANLTGNIAVTLTLAVFTFIITQVNGNKTYWGHIFNTPGMPWWLKTVIPIMPIVEFIGIFTKPFSLMIRLFANITAGHIIILSLFSLIFVFQSIFIGPVSVIFAVFMNVLELLVAVLQAYVFTLLTAMYFGSAVEEHHHDEKEHAH